MLRQLYAKAYPPSVRGGEEAETVLASQFVAGLKPEIRKRIAGCEYTSLDQLLIKARFEEAKQRELAEKDQPRDGSKQTMPCNNSNHNQSNSKQVGNQNGRRDNREHLGGEKMEFSPSNQSTKAQLNALIVVELATYPESRWRSSKGSGEKEITPYPETTGRKIRSLQAEPEQQKGRRQDEERKPEQKQSRVAELRKQLQLAEVEESLVAETNEATLCGISSTTDTKGYTELGPSITADVELEGIPIKTLLDTGSPVTIVSLEFIIEALLKKRPQRQTIEDWKAEFWGKSEPPTLSPLLSYGGGKLNTVRQLKVRIRWGKFSHDVIVQAEKNGSVPLLIGTDLQAKLGFQFVQNDSDGKAIDLLTKQEVVIGDSNSSFSKEVESQTVKPHGKTNEQAVVHLLQGVRLPADL